MIGALSELLGIDSWSAFEETVFHVGQTVQVQDHLLQEEIQRVLINMKNQKNQIQAPVKIPSQRLDMALVLMKPLLMEEEEAPDSHSARYDGRWN